VMCGPWRKAAEMVKGY